MSAFHTTLWRPFFCLLCDPTQVSPGTFITREECETHYKEVHFKSTSNDGHIQLWLDRELKYQESLVACMDRSLKTIPDKNKILYSGCPVCDAIIKVYDLRSLSSAKHEISLKDLDIDYAGNRRNHINAHLQYYAYECKMCSSHKTATKPAMTHHIKTKHLAPDNEIEKMMVVAKINQLEQLSYSSKGNSASECQVSASKPAYITFNEYQMKQSGSQEEVKSEIKSEVKSNVEKTKEGVKEGVKVASQKLVLIASAANRPGSDTKPTQYTIKTVTSSSNTPQITKVFYNPNSVPPKTTVSATSSTTPISIYKLNQAQIEESIAISTSNTVKKLPVNPISVTKSPITIAPQPVLKSQPIQTQVPNKTNLVSPLVIITNQTPSVASSVITKNMQTLRIAPKPDPSMIPLIPKTPGKSMEIMKAAISSIKEADKLLKSTALNASNNLEKMKKIEIQKKLAVQKKVEILKNEERKAKERMTMEEKKSKRGRPRLDLSEEERVDRVRDMKRLASQRYRDRKKKLRVDYSRCDWTEDDDNKSSDYILSSGFGLKSSGSSSIGGKKDPLTYCFSAISCSPSSSDSKIKIKVEKEDASKEDINDEMSLEYGMEYEDESDSDTDGSRLYIDDESTLQQENKAKEFKQVTLSSDEGDSNMVLEVNKDSSLKTSEKKISERLKLQSQITNKHLGNKVNLMKKLQKEVKQLEKPDQLNQLNQLDQLITTTPICSTYQTLDITKPKQEVVKIKLATFCVFCSANHFEDQEIAEEHYLGHLNVHLECAVCHQKFLSNAAFRKHNEDHLSPHNLLNLDNFSIAKRWVTSFLKYIPISYTIHKVTSFLFCPVCESLTNHCSLKGELVKGDQMEDEAIVHHLYHHFMYLPYKCIECSINLGDTSFCLDEDARSHLEEIHHIQDANQMDQTKLETYFVKKIPIKELEKRIDLCLKMSIDKKNFYR